MTLDSHEDSYCYVTTVGRTSGRPHEIEMWFARQGDSIYLLSGGGTKSDWVKNLTKTPKCAVRIGDSGPEYEAVARILTADNPESQLARRLVFGKYAKRRFGAAVESGSSTRATPATEDSTELVSRSDPEDLSGWRDRALPVALDIVGPITSTR